MSKNKENTTFRTAQRPHGSTSLAPTPQSEDFFTDSLLDASKIPTPSPKKPQAFALAYKGRRALGNTRTLKAAWEANTRNPRSVSSEDDPHGRPSSLPRPKLSPVQVQRRSPNPPRWNDEVTTPPGTRNEVERKSPTSDVLSPPPRGLTDVYQRIADEEDLAAQEGEIGEEEEEERYTEDMGPVVDWRAMAAKAGPPPHLPQTTPQWTSRHSTPQMESPELNKENLVPEEVTSMSEASGLSFWAGLTDQNLAAKMTPYAIDRAKDNDRLQKALMSDRRMLFNASRGSQDGDTHEVGKVEDNQVDDSSTGSTMTDPSQPLPRKPRAFGLAKYGKQMAEQRRAERARQEALEHERVPESSQVDWVAAAVDVALPSNEDSSTPRRSISRNSSAASLHKQSSLDRIRQWEVNDFTGQSFQVSQSPPVRARPSMLDPIKDKEIEHLARQAVTTNRLGKIREKDPRQLRQSSRSPSVGPAQLAQTPAPVKAEYYEEDQLNGEGEQIPDTPVVVFRTSSSSQPGDRKPERDAQGDHDRLRRLASAMSNGSRSGLTSEEWSFVDKEGENDHAVDLGKHQDDLRAQLESSQTPLAAVVNGESTPRISKTADIAKTPMVTGAWTDTILPDTTKSSKTRPSRYAQTPQVNVGGWMDTPADEAKRQSSAPVPLAKVPEELTDGIAREKPEEAPPNEMIIKSSLPKSALAGLLGRAKQRLASQDITTARETDTLLLGDATIESLEDLLTLDADSMATLMRMGADFDARQQLNNGSENQDPDEFLEYLGSQLKRVCANIHDTRKGMSRLEHQVNNEPDLHLPSSSSKNKSLTPSHPRHPDILETPWGYKLYLSIPIPKLFHPTQPSWAPRPTLLGYAVLAIWVWYIAEQSLCELYCRPLYTDHYDWPSTPEPVFPYALPTMLHRWSGLSHYGPYLLGPVWTVLVATVRILGQILGWSDGFVESPPYTGVVEGVKMAAGAAHSGLRDVIGGEGLSMMSDEFI